ncbi:cold-shock protein [Burkholderia glumae]|uniref:Cold-shock protein n=1 Tax=Burkholderia glumae TaxID=337 RepID=A0AAQ0BUA3_BURGL|nr:cold-shock protein [Burkholderia glumae]ACR29719.1 Hypothetical protein bglu_1g26440 [Burkholderia glumae BGR1]AJY65366.1 putative rNA methyltransferase TrmH, group 3 [Burkholderia glumae LMG 2196 = ATCC 33617]KHJ60130.1 cold-shock protein [Burkholderia glumae]MCM2482612.1 TfoX/Sxy family protein [Burkholderia glumae]MCM2490747.1 TfoX/Sxy family protein [Burkholderia glumae]
MTRDLGLEEVLNDELRDEAWITGRAMFGGWAWLADGNLLCAARHDGMLVRLGKGNDGWAVAMPGIEPMRNGGRPMTGWVWVSPQRCAQDALRRRLLDAALAFVRTLPPK